MKYLILFILVIVLIGAVCSTSIPATSCNCPSGWYAYQFGDNRMCRKDYTSVTGKAGFHLQGCER